MDFQFWLYLIFAIVWILVRALRKEPKREQQQGPVEGESPNKPMTFEELLREIQRSKTPPANEPEPTQQPTFQTTPPARSYDVDYDEDLEEEEQDLETIPTYQYRDEQTTDIYEEAKQQAFQRLSLEETMNVADTKVEFSHFKGYEETAQTTETNDFLKELSDREGFKKAFIMSEILKRKF